MAQITNWVKTGTYRKPSFTQVKLGTKRYEHTNNGIGSDIKLQFFMSISFSRKENGKGEMLSLKFDDNDIQTLKDYIAGYEKYKEDTLGIPRDKTPYPGKKHESHQG